ncbi:MAG: hypothetical protein MZV70_40860 [Desulfobacterales bacterium]|nr:hypothetical protein [Desulfobacterales bacterium]
MWGYSLAFGPDKAGIIGGLDFFLFSGITPASLEGTIPTNVFALFQMTFACITVALVLGSIVDRMKFSAWIVFTVLWVTFVYCPIAHWVWGKGWMATMGALDFAGRNRGPHQRRCRRAGAGAGARQAHRLRQGGDVPSSIALTALGAALLWFGWFGFNAGSALVADGLAGIGLPGHQHLGGRRGPGVDVHRVDGQQEADRARHRLGRRRRAGRHHAGGRLRRAGRLDPHRPRRGRAWGSSRWPGSSTKLGYDDSLDAFGVHGMCGTFGALATGLFADPADQRRRHRALLRQPEAAADPGWSPSWPRPAFTAIGDAGPDLRHQGADRRPAGGGGK